MTTCSQVTGRTGYFCSHRGTAALIIYGARKTTDTHHHWCPAKGEEAITADCSAGDSSRS